jgi:hypothetical protein
MKNETQAAADDRYLVTVITTKGVYPFRNGLDYLTFIQGVNPLDVIAEEWEEM